MHTQVSMYRPFDVQLFSTGGALAIQCLGKDQKFLLELGRETRDSPVLGVRNRNLSLWSA